MHTWAAQMDGTKSSARLLVPTTHLAGRSGAAARCVHRIAAARADDHSGIGLAQAVAFPLCVHLGTISNMRAVLSPLSSRLVDTSYLPCT